MRKRFSKDFQIGLRCNAEVFVDSSILKKKKRGDWIDSVFFKAKQ